jgi:hypothetical protein
MAHPDPISRPGARENLRDVLIAGFETSDGLPSKRTATPRRRGPSIQRLTFQLTGAASFFIGVFGGTALGCGLALLIGYFTITARSAVVSTLPWLVPPLDISGGGLVVFTFFGGVIGLVVGCLFLAPRLQRGHVRTRRYG